VACEFDVVGVKGGDICECDNEWIEMAPLEEARRVWPKAAGCDSRCDLWMLRGATTALAWASSFCSRLYSDMFSIVQDDR
jgi:hypothetical protein